MARGNNINKYLQFIGKNDSLSVGVKLTLQSIIIDDLKNMKTTRSIISCVRISILHITVEELYDQNKSCKSNMKCYK